MCGWYAESRSRRTRCGGIRRLPPTPHWSTAPDAVVNLAGADLGARRWTPDYRRTILTSRTGATGTLAVAVARAANPPTVLLSASGIRYYGVDRGNEPLDESTPPVRDGFLPLAASASYPPG